MAMGSQRESASTVQVDSMMERFKMYALPRATPPREGNGEPRPCLFVRIRCSVGMSTETHLVGRTPQRHGRDNNAADARRNQEEAAARRFTVHDPTVLRSEPACHAAVRRMLTDLPQLAGYYGHRAADVQLWDRFVPPGLVSRIVARVAREDDLVAGGEGARRSRSYACYVWLRVHVTSVYSEPKALLLSCEDAAAGARDGSGTLVGGGGGAAQCAICMEEMAASGVGVVALPGCSHAFHRGCILKWFHRAATCPSCRRDMMHHVPHMCRLWRMLN